MHAAYYETRFNAEEPIDDWPAEFAIITAYATTGEQWTDEQNLAADENLRLLLEGASVAIPKVWCRRLTGYSPTTGHAEPGWAAALDFATACKVGENFRQDAIYFVSNGWLSVTHCKDGHRELAPVERFADRVTVEPQG